MPATWREAPPVVLGVVLTGGRSSRFGSDKALACVDGVPMARRVADTFVAAGVDRVFAVGGDRVALEALGLEVVEDRWPGEGPLGGLSTALSTAPAGPTGAGSTASPDGSVVVALACDLAWIDAGTVRAVLAPVIAGTADACVGATSGRWEPLIGAWRVGPCRPVAEAAMAAGERAVHSVVAALDRAGRLAIVDVDPQQSRNVNRREDLGEGRGR